MIAYVYGLMLIKSALTLSLDYITSHTRQVALILNDATPKGRHVTFISGVLVTYYCNLTSKYQNRQRTFCYCGRYIKGFEYRISVNIVALNVN